MTENATLTENTTLVFLGGRGVRQGHFATANGFPPQVYRPLVDALGDVCVVYALLPLAMRNSAPPPRRLHWRFLADEMAQQLRAAGLHDLIGMGHSLGGTLSLFAAARHPGLFRALVLLDPVMFPYRYLLSLALLRLLGLHQRLPLVARARRRRAVFASREEAAAHYRTRPLFAAWHPQAFAAYIEHGLVPLPEGQGVRLAYPPAWEAAIFATAPLSVWYWARKVRLPTLVIYGERSHTFLPPARRKLQRLWPHAHFVALPRAGHMFPMERPDETAQIVREWVETQSL